MHAIEKIMARAAGLPLVRTGEIVNSRVDRAGITDLYRQLNTPSTPSTIGTCFDGCPMAKNGRGGEALYTASFASGTVILIAFALPLATWSLQFGPPEFFWTASSASPSFPPCPPRPKAYRPPSMPPLPPSPTPPWLFCLRAA
ncbi:tripartite tricarboxylate transporter permease [Mailhella sp.]|uniref:tripartite tricarboxylate transporter permease n=1 Tax=Mailhella sp. TaxID=1981029 RepID=UPI0040630D93